MKLKKNRRAWHSLCASTRSFAILKARKLVESRNFRILRRVSELNRRQKEKRDKEKQLLYLAKTNLDSLSETEQLNRIMEKHLL
jgi:hypothetical protein